MPIRRFVALLAAAALTLAVGGAPAQGGGKVSSLGGGQSHGKLLSYDELAACLKEQAELAPRREKIEAERARLDSERQQLLQLDESLKAERAKLDQVQQAVASINQRTQEQAKKIADFNERNAKLNSSTAGGPLADRERADLQREREQIEAEGKALDADRSALSSNTEQQLKAFNARVTARDQAASDWNARNAAATKAAQEYEADREVWAGDCAGRPYREDDEKDIRKGK